MYMLNMLSKEKAAEIVNRIQSDPKLIEEFQTAPIKAIEKAGGIDIPDFMEGTLEKIIREHLAGSAGKDPMEIISKYLK